MHLSPAALVFLLFMATFALATACPRVESKKTQVWLDPSSPSKKTKDEGKGPRGSDPPTSCCFTYMAKKIPRNYIADFYKTNSRCFQPGVVFITKKGREICANPTEKWVQEYMDHFKLN